jgi:ATP-dependent Clp protease adapter protein ClpS
MIEKKQLKRLNFREEIELRIHLAGCGMCVLYNKQSRAINNMVQQLFHDSLKNELKLDETFKTDLQARIEEGLGNN